MRKVRSKGFDPVSLSAIAALLDPCNMGSFGRNTLGGVWLSLMKVGIK